MSEVEGEVERIYGFHPVQEALKNPRRNFIRLLATRNAAERIASPIKPEIVIPKELDRLVGPDAVHQGLILEARPLRQPRLDQIERKGLILLLDQVTDPHNVGAIIRSCAALGAQAVVTPARHSPQASGVLLKAASGAYEHVPYIKVTNLARAITEIRQYGFFIIGLASEANQSIEEVPTSEPLGIVLGAEGKGLRQLTRDSCDILVRLTTLGPIQSLNVSTAAAVALYALNSSRGRVRNAQLR
jgi:23S rRNA (guanosine2251-2'-O)-methyltransferase